MTLNTRLATLVLAVLLGLASPALARTCVNPGSILDVPTPGYLKPGKPDAETPDLYLETDAGDLPVTVVSLTASRMQLLIPATAPYDSRIKIHHRAAHGPGKTVGNSRTCAQNAGTGGGGTGSGGTGGGGTGGGGTGGGSDGSAADNGQKYRRDLTRFQNKPLERATRSDVAAPSGAPEVVLIGTARAVSKAESVVMAAGGSVLRSRLLANMGLKLTAVDIGGALTLNQLRAELARNAVSVTADRHSVYGAAQGPMTYAWPMVGADPVSPCHLPRPVRIGIIDGPIDQTNPALQGISIRSFSALNDNDLVGSTDHATGIASLIAGNGQTDLPAGLAQGADLFAVTAFAKSGGRDVARLENIAAVLDWLIGARVQVVNMSLAGPENASLGEIVRIADENGMIIVAAAGNGGQAALAYPASDDRVIGVTAIDAARRLYRKANTGAGLDFAAPGVDVLVANRSGTGFRSGTSYAAAIATGIIAQQAARGVAGRAAAMTALKNSAEDLGDAGLDATFGWGLIHFGGC